MIITMVGAKNFAVPSGITRHVIEVSSILVEMGHEVHVILNSGDNGEKYEKYRGIHIHRIRHIQNKYINKISMVPDLLSELSLIDSDIIHAHDAVCGFAAQKFSDQNFVYTIHGFGHINGNWPFFAKYPLQMMEKKLVQDSSYVTAVDSTSLKIGKIWRKDIELIPNGVNISLYLNKRDKPQEYLDDSLSIVFAGRLVETKGIEYLINTFNEKNSRLYILGSGPLEKKIELMVRGRDNISLLGFKSDIIPYLQHADIFVLPSSFEGMPIALLEAMAAETACISFDVGDLKERFKDMEEICFTDTENFPKMLHTIANNDELRNKIAMKANNCIKKEYSWDKVAHSYEKIYQKLIQQNIQNEA